MALLEGLTWAKFMEISETETTEGKYGIPRFDGSPQLLQEYSFRVRMRALQEKSMTETEVKKLGPLGVRLVEGLRGPALHIVKNISPDVLASEKGPDTILQDLTTALRPRRQQEARELYMAGAKEHGPLSRQHGEPMSTYILRRKAWWAILQDLDSEIKLPEVILAEQILSNAKVSEDHMLMIRTSLNQKITVQGVCDELLNQHGGLHQREKRGSFGQPSSSWKPRAYKGNFGKFNIGKGKFKGSGYWVQEEQDDGAEEAYHGMAWSNEAWDNVSQNLGYEDDLGNQTAETYHADYEYVESEDVAGTVLAAMIADGLDEQYDQESADYAADIAQAEAEAYFLRQQAQSKGHSGFGHGQRYEVRGELSLEERKARVTALKSRTSCRRCGQKGHWSGDAACPKGAGKGKRPHSSGSSTTTSSSKSKGLGKPGRTSGPSKPRQVYFAVTEDVLEDGQALLAYKGDFSRVPPPSSLSAQQAPTTLSGMLQWRGPQGTSQSADAALSTASQGSWQLTEGPDWDNQMLFEALQANRDVVIDQMVAATQQMEVDQGPGLLMAQGEEEIRTEPDKDEEEELIPVPSVQPRRLSRLSRRRLRLPLLHSRRHARTRRSPRKAPMATCGSGSAWNVVFDGRARRTRTTAAPRSRMSWTIIPPTVDIATFLAEARTAMSGSGTVSTAT